MVRSGKSFAAPRSNGKQTLFLRVDSAELHAKPKKALRVDFVDSGDERFQWTCAPGDSADAIFEAWSVGAELCVVARVVSSYQRFQSLLVDVESCKLCGVPRGVEVY